MVRSPLGEWIRVPVLVARGIEVSNSVIDDLRSPFPNESRIYDRTVPHLALLLLCTAMS